MQTSTNKLSRQSFITFLSAAFGLLVMLAMTPAVWAQDNPIQVKSPNHAASEPAVDMNTQAIATPRISGKKYYGAFRELRVTDIKPEGWLHSYLITQRNGLTGHLENAGDPFDTVGWAGPHIRKDVNNKDSWAAYEQYAYWVDGMLRCGYQIDDESLLKKAKAQIQYVVDHPAPDGILGPVDTPEIRWPHVVFFRSMMVEYGATGNQKIVDALLKHYKAERDQNLIDVKMPREICNLEQLCWLYGQTGQQWLLEYAAKILNDSSCIKDMLAPWPTHGHGATCQERFKLPTIFYLYTGDQMCLNTNIKQLLKLESEHMLVSGSTSAAEDFIGTSDRACHETCNISDFAWNLGYTLLATGDAEWADRIERCVLNAGTSMVTKDFKTHEYYTAPNQVLATRMSNHEFGALDNFAFRPGHDIQCCTGQVNRIMPNYVARMWLGDTAGGLAAAMYGPCKVNTVVNGQKVTIVERTEYPFSDRIEFEVQTAKPVRMLLSLRIPGWCKKPDLTIDGRPAGVELVPGKFAVISREFKNSEKLVLTLPMTVKMSHWPHHGVALERGPLVYSLLIPEARTINEKDPRSNKDFPAYEIMPAGPWNYALDIDANKVEEQVKVVKLDMTENPYAAATIQLQVPARKVKDWTLEITRDRFTYAQCTYTPALPRKPDFEDKQETITLVPLGCTCIRLTVFPWTKAQW